MRRLKLKIIGYARVSTTHQNLDSQILALEKYGCTKIYTERKSGRSAKRPILQQVLEKLEPGDTLVIFKLDRLSRGTRHLLTLMEYFEKNDINFVSIQNSIDTSTTVGKFFFTVMSAFAEMEADLIRERVVFGLEAAREKGVVLGRPTVELDIEQMIIDYENVNLSINEVIERHGMTRPPKVYCFFRYSMNLNNK